MTDAAEQLAAHLARKEASQIRLAKAPAKTERFDPARPVSPLAARLLRASNGLREAAQDSVIL